MVLIVCLAVDPLGEARWSDFLLIGLESDSLR